MRAVGDRSVLGFAREQFRKDFFSPDRNIRAAAYGKQLMGASIYDGWYSCLQWYDYWWVPKDTNLRRQKFDTGYNHTHLK